MEFTHIREGYFIRFDRQIGPQRNLFSTAMCSPFLLLPSPPLFGQYFDPHPTKLGVEPSGLGIGRCDRWYTTPARMPRSCLSPASYLFNPPPFLPSPAFSGSSLSNVLHLLSIMFAACSRSVSSLAQVYEQLPSPTVWERPRLRSSSANPPISQ